MFISLMAYELFLRILLEFCANTSHGIDISCSG